MEVVGNIDCTVRTVLFAEVGKNEGAGFSKSSDKTFDNGKIQGGEGDEMGMVPSSPLVVDWGFGFPMAC